MTSPSTPAGALALGVLAMGLLTVMDAVAKSLADHLGTLQITGLRFGLTALLAAAVALATRARWPQRSQWPQHAGRAALMLLATACFFHALGRLPLVTVFALSLTAPLFIALLGALWLGDPMGPGTRIALALGVAGALVTLAGVAGDREAVASKIELTQAAGWGAFLEGSAFAMACAVAAPLGYAFSVVWLRQQTRGEDAPDVAAVVALQAAFAAGLLATVGAPALMAGWKVPQAGGVVAVLVQGAALGVLATVGYLAFAAALKRLPAGRVAVIEYTGLLWAAALGWLVFGERPTVWDVAGAALVVGGCLQAARGAKASR